ncbi:pectinesterase-like isoform X2 [Rutidosis leptorrhynchoides]
MSDEIDLHKAGGEKTAILIAATTVYILCKYTDFRDICRETLERIRTRIRKPRELILGGFNTAMDQIHYAIENSYTLKKTAKDPRAVIAIDQCKELLSISIEDLKKSVDRVSVIDINKLKYHTIELRVWLSGAVTYQDTCLDAFVNTTGDSGLQMTRLLDLGVKHTRNSLAMIDGVIELSGGKPPRYNDYYEKRESSQSTTVVDYRVDQTQLQQQQQLPIQPKKKRHFFDWTVKNPQPEPNNVVVVQQTEVQQPKPTKTKTVNVDYKGDLSISRNEDPKQTAGNIQRILDEQAEPEFLSDTPYPSWTDSSRRSLINVDPKTVKPNAVVAQDGSGGFKTIMQAVNTAPKRSPAPFIILIKAGIYKEDVTIPRHTDNVVFIGEGPTKTKITGRKNYIDGTSTYKSATVAVDGDGFMAKDIGFENSAGPEKHQAVALRVSADMSIFHNCLIEGYQDTLYTHSYRQFYRQCEIKGTIDFIFGNAAAVFQDCKMIIRKPMNNQACMVTAQGRKDQHSVGGIVMDGCTITAEPAFLNAVPMPKSYLGRPWKEFSRTIIMQSFLDKNIDPEGWSVWAGTFALDTCYYAEFKNKGPGADTSKRVTWKGIKKISPQEAQRFAPGTYIQGDQWIKPTNVPYEAGLMKI